MKTTESSADVLLQTEEFLERPRSRVLHDSTIEINLSNSKRTEQGLGFGGLTDKGVEVFIQTLTECLKSPHGSQLLELHLTGNKLTVKSLPALAKVIELSADYLRDLDLSNNEIRVEVKEEMELWAEFLGSFEKCSMLKRVNLGGNPLGSFGMELLTKAYIQNSFAVQRPNDRSDHPDSQKLLDQLPSATRVHIERGVSSIKYLFKVPQGRWYINIARAVRAAGLLTLDQHLRIRSLRGLGMMLSPWSQSSLLIFCRLLSVWFITEGCML